MSITPPSLRNINTRELSNPFIQIAFLLIILVLFSWFILKPKLSQSTESRQTLKAAEEQYKVTQHDEQELNRLIGQMRSSSKEITKIDEALPLSGRASKAYVLLDNLVKTSGMSIILINTSDTADSISAGDKDMLKNPYQPGRSLHTLSFQVSISGNMDQFRNFLQLIETNGRVLDVTDVEVAGGDPITKFRVTVKAYAYEKLDPKAIQ